MGWRGWYSSQDVRAAQDERSDTHRAIYAKLIFPFLQTIA